MATASPVLKLLRRALRRGPADDPQAQRPQSQRPGTGPLARAIVKVADIVFPTNSSGNNRSVR